MSTTNIFQKGITMKTSGYIIVEGNIGAGKSTFASALTNAFRRLGMNAFYLPEPADGTNPYLNDYYKKPKEFAFSMQNFLLSKRYALTQFAQWGAQAGQGWFILDRSYFGDVCFANVQYKIGTMDERDFLNYISLHHALETNIHNPTAAIFLNSSAQMCKSRIDERLSKNAGRKCESDIDINYLQLIQDEINNLQMYMNKKCNTYAFNWETPKSKSQIQEFCDDLACQIATQKSESRSLEAYSPWGDFIFVNHE